MRIVSTTILTLLLAAPLESQGRPKATLADSNVVTENVFQFLLGGIRLSNAQVTEAKAIIRQTIRQQYEGQRGTPSEQRGRAVALNAVRDSTLAKLIPSAAERVVFWDRAAALHSGRPRPPKNHTRE